LLTTAAFAQDYGRVPSGLPLKWGSNSSVEVMPRELAYHYRSTDSTATYRRHRASLSTPMDRNPNATRFDGLRAQCDANGLVLNWMAIQAFGADRYEVEQSSDGRNWTVVGVVPARQTRRGEALYSFAYAKNARDGFFRITATSIGGDRVVSSMLESPCSPTALLSVTPNPVYSTATLRIGSPTAIKVRLMILDTHRAMVFSSDASLVAGTNHLPVDMSRLPAGHYLLVISWSGGKEETLNLVKR
jgi:hypothetical protein